MDDVGGGPGGKAGGQEHHDGGQARQARDELRPDGEHEHQPETEEHVVARHMRIVTPPGAAALIRIG